MSDGECNAWDQNLGECAFWSSFDCCQNPNKVMITDGGVIIYCSGNGYRAWGKKRE